MQKTLVSGGRVDNFLSEINICCGVPSNNLPQPPENKVSPQKRILSSDGVQTNYVMIPRIAIKLLEHDLGVMADWIERSGYGADMNKLKLIQDELNIVPTSLKDWLKAKIEIQNKTRSSRSRQWKSTQWKLQWDK